MSPVSPVFHAVVGLKDKEWKFYDKNDKRVTSMKRMGQTSLEEISVLH